MNKDDMTKIIARENDGNGTKHVKTVYRTNEQRKNTNVYIYDIYNIVYRLQSSFRVSVNIE